MRSPDRAKQDHLLCGPVAALLDRNYIDQQISPCFLQDLQSEWKKEQMEEKLQGYRFQGTTKLDDAVPTSFDRTSILLPNKDR